MSLTATDRRFARRAETLWRDTGHHVVALTERRSADVVILGGGSAVLWRLLADRLSVSEILARLAASGKAAAPTEDEVLACLQELVSLDLVHERGDLAP